MVKPPLIVRGMLGIGDCLHQRAVLRELIKTHAVVLDPAYYGAMYHDVAGLTLCPRFGPYTAALDPGHARAPVPRVPAGARAVRITYTPGSIVETGSILAAQFASVGLAMPARPDFGLAVPQAWRERARALLGRADRPVLVYRPLIYNTVWARPSRHPDPATYAAIFRSLRERFYVVSIANLRTGRESMVKPVAAVDLALHGGELDFPTMAGLFADAALALVNPGFAPILAQAVGTPLVCVYGGNESSATTQRVGMHLAPTLAIEPDHPCDCHDWHHRCDKTTALEPALAKVREFIDRCVISSSAPASSTRSTAPGCSITG